MKVHGKMRDCHQRGPVTVAGWAGCREWTLLRDDFNFLNAGAVSLSPLSPVLQDRETLKVIVKNVNSGGMLSVLDGLPAFVPYSLVTKQLDDPYMSIEVCTSLSLTPTTAEDCRVLFLLLWS